MTANASVSLVLAPGASGTPAGMRRYVDALRDRGVESRVIALPTGTAERAVPAYRRAASPSPSTVIGGQSFGGRVASLLAAEDSYAGLVLFSYPLHAPGRPERWQERTRHWPRIECPVLLLSGDRDPFARVDLLRTAVEQLPQAELLIYPGVRHGIGSVLDQAMDRVAAFMGSLG